MLRVRMALACLLLGTLATAQTREEGPWWPHPRWGADDQAGASNWITPGKVLEAIEMVETGEVYELGHVYEATMPLFGNRTYAMKLLASGPATGKNQLVGNSEFLCAEIGQVGTQFDGLGHIGTQMRMEDGTVKEVYYNGFTGEEVISGNGLVKLGVEHVKPFITRGILIDIEGYKGADALAGTYEVTLQDVRGALENQNLTEQAIRDGDAVLFHYGAEWDDSHYVQGAGFGLEVARWLVTQNVSMVGSDRAGEVMPNPDPELAFPAHQELLTKNGVFHLESMNLESLVHDEVYEFMFVFTPIRFKGATGSPGRPLAIR